MFIDSLKQLYEDRFKKLSRKEKRLLVYLALAVLASVYFGAFFKPNLNKLADLKKRNREASGRLESLLAQLPQPEKVKKELRDYYANLENIKSRTKEVESQLLGISSAQKLVKELIAGAQGKKIDFQSVKQRMEQEKDGYSRLYVDLEFDSTYRDMLVYLGAVEKISPFVKIENIDVSQAKSDPVDLVTVSISLTAVISPFSQQGELSIAQAEASSKKIDLKRSPLSPSIKITKDKKRSGLKLIGITYRKNSADSSAIINNTVIREGQEIDGVKVEKIMPDSVEVIENGESRALSVER